MHKFVLAQQCGDKPRSPPSWAWACVSGGEAVIAFSLSLSRLTSSASRIAFICGSRLRRSLPINKGAAITDLRVVFLDELKWPPLEVSLESIDRAE